MISNLAGIAENRCSAGNLMERLRAGEDQALAELFGQHRERLWHIVHSRLDRRLGGRVDADDVLQEIYVDASDRIGHFVNEHSGSFFVWLLLITTQTITNVHRRHLSAGKRDVRREISIFSGGGQPASTSLALQLLGHLTSPSQAAIREETARQLEEAVQGMSAKDREVLTLRHLEELTNSEVAELLGIQTKAASIRYIRALKRLKDVVANIPGLEI